MFAKVSPLTLALLTIGSTAFALQQNPADGHGSKGDCPCCVPKASPVDVVADLDKRIADLEKEITEKGDFLLENVHTPSKFPIHAKECLALLKRDRAAAIRHQGSKPSPDSLVWVGKRHVRYSQLPKEQAAVAQTCDHHGFRWITVGKAQWRIKNCSEIPRALQPNPSLKYSVACCQGGTCCSGEGHCSSTGCCKKGAGCCMKPEGSREMSCKGTCGCLLGCPR